MGYWLIDDGAGLSGRPNHIETTGMSHAVKRASVDFVHELLDNHGGDAQNGQLHSALWTWPKDDIAKMLVFLLDRGAPLNITMYANDERSPHNYCVTDLGTPLHDATQKGYVEAGKYLLAQGADTSSLSSRKQATACDWAEKSGHNDIAAILRVTN